MRGPVVSSRVPAAARVETTSTVATPASTASVVFPPDLATQTDAGEHRVGSTAFVMSCRVSPAIATAVSASISTPVRPVTFAVAVIVIDASPNSKSTVTEHSAAARGRAGSELCVCLRGLNSRQPGGGQHVRLGQVVGRDERDHLRRRLEYRRSRSPCGA